MSSGEDENMDPNTALTEIRRLLARGRFEDLSPTDSHRLVELVEALDGWLSGAGFLPTSWEERHVVRLERATSTKQPWWQVRPSESAWRYGCDPDQLQGDINPEDLSDWQFDLVMAALATCEKRMARMSVPEE